MASLAPLYASFGGCWPAVTVCLATASPARYGSPPTADLHPLPAGGHSRTIHPDRDLSREAARMAQSLRAYAPAPRTQSAVQLHHASTAHTDHGRHGSGAR